MVEQDKGKIEKRGEKTDLILAYFDILGFSRMVEYEGLDKVYDKYTQLVQLIKSFGGRLVFTSAPASSKGGRVPVSGYQKIKHAFASDTFLLWTKYDRIGFPPFCDSCAEFLCRSLELGIPLRGAISMGEAIIDLEKRIFIGMPIIESSIVEKSQRWIGIGFGNSLGNKKYSYINELEHFIRYESHIKAGKDNVVQGLVVDWPRKWRKTRDYDVKDVLNELDVDQNHSDIYSNTKAFVDFSLENSDWIEKLVERERRKLAET